MILVLPIVMCQEISTVSLWNRRLLNRRRDNLKQLDTMAQIYLCAKPRRSTFCVFLGNLNKLPGDPMQNMR